MRSARAAHRTLKLTDRPDRAQQERRQAREGNREQRDQHRTARDRRVPDRGEETHGHAQGDAGPEQGPAQVARRNLREDSVDPERQSSRPEQEGDDEELRAQRITGPGCM